MIHQRSVLIRGGQVLDDLAPERTHRTQDVLVENGRISAVAANLPSAGADVIDAGGGIVLAGMTDTHRHTWQAVVRGLCGDMSVIQYLQSIRWGVAAHFTPDDVYYATLVGALEMIDAGVTQVVDFSHCMNTPEHADAAYRGLVDAGIRAVFAYGFNAVPVDRPHFTSHEQRLADFARVVGTYAGKNELVTVGASLSDFNQTDIETLETEIAFVRETGSPITFHPGALRPNSPYQTVSLLEQRGLLGPDMILAHCTNASDDELRMLRDAHAWVSSTPETEMQMGMGFPVVGRMLGLGMKPTLGVDVVSACSGDLFAQIRLALQTERALRQTGDMEDVMSFTSREALRFATEYGAESVRLPDVTGRIEPGAAGDVVVLKPRLFEFAPIIDPVVSAVLHANAASVDAVLVGGRVLKREGRLVAADVPQLCSRSSEVGARVVRRWRERGGLSAPPSAVEEKTLSRLDA